MTRKGFRKVGRERVFSEWRGGAAMIHMKRARCMTVVLAGQKKPPAISHAEAAFL